jgi:hypothetical protein
VNKQIAKWSLCGVSMLVLPLLAFAQTTYSPPSGQTVTLTSIMNAIVSIANFMIYIGVAVAVIFIIWGGIAYMMAGGDDTKIETAKKRIITGIIGAAIIIGVGAIIRTLQYILVTSGTLG